MAYQKEELLVDDIIERPQHALHGAHALDRLAMRQVRRVEVCALGGMRNHLRHMLKSLNDSPGTHTKVTRGGTWVTY